MTQTPQVLIKLGHYGANNKWSIENKQFELRKTFNGSYVTVWCNPGDIAKGDVSESREVRVKISSEDDFVYLGEVPASMMPKANVHFSASREISPEDQQLVDNNRKRIDDERKLQDIIDNQSDEDRLKHINKSFLMLRKFADLTLEGKLKGLIVVGPPGLGKSHEVLEAINRSETFTKLAGESEKHFIAKGTISAVYLYQKLFEYKESHQTLILDDVDIGGDTETLNTLKAALDTTGTRRITWLKNSKVLDGQGIPEAFNFEGSIVCLTNEEFAGRSGAKGMHLGAVLDRCHTNRLEIHTIRDKMLRIKDVVLNSPMLDKFNMDTDNKHELLEFMYEYREHLTEMTLRTAINIAVLYDAEPQMWKDMSIASCMNPSAMQAQFLKEIEAEEK